MIELNGKYSDAKIYTDNIEQEALGQIIELINTPAFENTNVRIMPDTHAGKGCVIGFTAIMKDKVVPNLIGVDIGCGMLTVKLGDSELSLTDIDYYIHHNIPHGCKNNNKIVANVSGIEKDVISIAKKMNKDYGNFLKGVGSLGGGNHFIEIGVDNQNNKYLVIHSGSRNFGKCVAEYHQRIAEKYCFDKVKSIHQDKIEELKRENKISEISEYIEKIKDYNKKYSLPKHLCFLEGELKNNYIYDLRVAQKYASISRHNMANRIVKSLGLTEIERFETIHNYMDDSGIVRKGAISAKEDELVLIPLNMRDGSIIGRGKGNPEWNYSAPHGAGRLMSRSKAKSVLKMEDFEKEMSNVYSTSVKESTLDEAPMAYKPSEEIVMLVQDTIEVIDIIKPIYNFKSN